MARAQKEITNKILLYLKRNPGASTFEIARGVNINSNTANKYLHSKDVKPFVKFRNVGRRTMWYFTERRL